MMGRTTRDTDDARHTHSIVCVCGENNIIIIIIFDCIRSCRVHREEDKTKNSRGRGGEILIKRGSVPASSVHTHKRIILREKMERELRSPRLTEQHGRRGALVCKCAERGSFFILDQQQQQQQRPCTLLNHGKLILYIYYADISG